MIVRSQNKKYIVNLDNIIEIAVHDKNVVCNGSYSHVGLLGAYSTEEKAMKVLDMICEAYSRCESTKELASGILLEAAKRFSQNEAEEFKKEHRAIFMFQMPQDSEV